MCLNERSQVRGYTGAVNNSRSENIYYDENYEGYHGYNWKCYDDH